MSEFDTYIHLRQKIAPEHNVFQMFIQQDNGNLIFKGLVSENAKKIIQSDNTINEMNELYNAQVLLSTFTKKDIEQSKKVYLFIPCPYADISIFKPIYKNEKDIL